ncbi:hypothetical protein M3182_19300 [Mesobacillus maritimus]|mgnify:CR=1 FL=1|nr:hypothetical protein [Mesobacillus maritimus]MCM3587874.1 hypothetical protein [Mesobacillus maritimus]MCM3670048.1 hypothetical protein [Mesobacillus maritimus]
MEKPKRNDRETYSYIENGTSEVTQQIMDSYNSGVIDASLEETSREEG